MTSMLQPQEAMLQRVCIGRLHYLDTPRLTLRLAGFLYRSEYQLFYTGPSLYTVVMFAIMLRDVTHGSSTILFKNFLPLFSLIQMQATAMSSLPTFVGTSSCSN